jgi:hypothetical protein
VGHRGDLGPGKRRRCYAALPHYLPFPQVKGQTASPRVVVRGRVELPTFRFSEGLSRPGRIRRMKLDSPLDQHMGPSGSRGSSLAGVPSCTGECRLVRVTAVLAIWDARTCVALVLASQDRSHCADRRQRKWHRRLPPPSSLHPPSWGPARVLEPTTAWLTYSDEQNGRQLPKVVHIADTRVPMRVVIWQAAPSRVAGTRRRAPAP